MFKRLIVATDLSPASFALIKCLEYLKPLKTEECLLLQCLSVQETASIALSSTASILEENFKKQREILEGFGFKVDTRVIPGQIKNELNRIASREDYSLIVTGAQKQSAASEAFFKGLAYDIIHHAKKPVLLLRLKDTPEGVVCARDPDLNENMNVLFPTDFSKNADLAFDYLLEMVGSGVKNVTLMHVQDKGQLSPNMVGNLEDFNEVDRERIENMQSKLMDAGVNHVNVVIKYGSPSDEIIDYADENEINMIVMGSQGRGFVKELFLGSVSHSVARNANCSVLLIPAKRS
ncbi:universal stress protein [Alkalibacter mobilis]|uniref:universal stress protein n=1 Tax=Alkalibacter mobilis TaxID=2787712 RepID=UPI0018A08F35|nr:universal stress protein [Alkalibacter mobilis]MBF7096041.1 universal stress protein [Alkalibacter mobilis]